MELVLSVLEELQINSSVFYFLAVVFIMFFISRKVFFNKLQDLLEMRREKTSKLETKAESVFEKAQEMETEYLGKITEARSKAYKSFQDRKQSYVSDKADVVKKKESEVEGKVEAARASMNKEISEQKEKLLNEVGSLAEELTKKVVL